MNDLINHIAALNNKTQTWINEDPKNRWASLVADDAAMWNNQGIYTPEQLDHYFLVCNVFEAIRSLHDYKPHWGNLNSMTDAELQYNLDSLNSYARAQFEREELDEQQHVMAMANALNHQSGFAIAELNLL